uniref:Uncharacterized protein n=1 Tax=Lotus japonicus TaxID=34305 RepID=I3S1C8_LOTJA|nr:unknown [Lotus japonicus]
MEEVQLHELNLEERLCLPLATMPCLFILLSLKGERNSIQDLNFVLIILVIFFFLHMQGFTWLISL